MSRAAVLITPEAARFLDEVRDSITGMGLRVVSEERIRLRRPEAAAALQVLSDEAAAKEAAADAAAAPAKGKKPAKGAKGKAEPEPESPRKPKRQGLSKDEISTLTAGDVLVVTVGQPSSGSETPGGGEGSGARDVWEELSSIAAPGAAGGLAATIAEAMVAAAEDQAEGLPSLGLAAEAVEAARGRAARRHVFAASTREGAARLATALGRAAVRARTDRELEEERAARRERARDDWVEPAAVMRFVFPPAQQHPRSSGRLVALALFGPLDADGRLRGGFRRSRAVRDHELSCAIDRVEEEDVLAVFAKGGPLGDGDRRAVRNEVGDAAAALPRMGPAQVRRLLAGCGPADDRGRLRFRAIQSAVLAARETRRERMAGLFHSLGAAAAAGREARAADAAAEAKAGAGSSQRSQPRPAVELEAPPPRFGRSTLRARRSKASRRGDVVRPDPSVTSTLTFLQQSGAGAGAQASEESVQGQGAGLSATRTLKATGRVRRRASRNAAATVTAPARATALSAAAQSAMGGTRLPTRRAAGASVAGAGLRGAASDWMRGGTAPFLGQAVRAASAGVGGSGGGAGADSKADDDTLGAFLGALDAGTRAAAGGPAGPGRARRERQRAVESARRARHAGTGRAASSADRSPGRDGPPSKTGPLDVTRKRGENGLRRTLERLQAKNTHQIAALGATASHPGVALNARLLRAEPPSDLAGWDSFAPFSKPRTVIYRRGVAPGSID